MRYIPVPVQLDLNDPESSFSFSSSGNTLSLSLLDWSCKKVDLKFKHVFRFIYSISDSYKDFPEASFVEVVDSTDIHALIIKHIATSGDGLRHFVISTNEDEWCEIIASSYDLKLGS